MSFDRQEYQDFIKSKATERVNGNRANLERLAQAQVSMENVTGDKDWDTFLQFLQAAIDNAYTEINALATRMADRKTVNPDEIMSIKLDMAFLDGHIRAWEGVVELPKDIKASGEQARDLLSRLGDSQPFDYE